MRGFLHEIMYLPPLDNIKWPRSATMVAAGGDNDGEGSNPFNSPSTSLIAGRSPSKIRIRFATWEIKSMMLNQSEPFLRRNPEIWPPSVGCLRPAHLACRGSGVVWHDESKQVSIVCHCVAAVKTNRVEHGSHHVRRIETLQWNHMRC